MGHDTARIAPLEVVSRTDFPAVPSSAREGEARGLSAIDDIARDPMSAGLVYVHGASSVLDALGAHITRRSRARGRAVVRVAGLLCDDAFRELAARVGASDVSDPLAAAESIASHVKDAVVVVHEPSPTHWGRAVAEELARIAAAPSTGALFVILTDAATHPPGSASSARRLAVDAVLSPDGVRRFWEAVAEDAGRMSAAKLDRLDALEGWWSAARAVPFDERPAAPELSDAARRLHARLALSRRSFPIEHADRLGSSVARDELLRRGILELDAHGRLVSAPSAPAPIVAEVADAIAVAEALEALHRADAWALMRASELFATGGDALRAEAAAVRAISGVMDVAARADFWRRWERAAAELPESGATPRQIRAADLALRVGDIDRALSFANAAVARVGETYETMLALGRATTARGDLTTAAFVLKKAVERAPHDSARARAAVEMAEVRYMEGKLDEARRYAEEGLALSTDLTTRLLARNVLGKHHLARAQWAEAEQHFAADACEAACGGDLIAELRARLNRAIALLSSGRWDESRSMLTAVLEEGQERGELNAIAFALTNLSTIAIFKHEYGTALSLLERSLDVVRRIGDRIRLALTITNLAELRLQIGLVAEADQALAFGRKACGPGMPSSRAAHFALVAARVHLARGNTLDAAAEVSSALQSAQSSHNGDKLGECHRLAARVALEDGDVLRAAQAIAGARSSATSSFAQAEVALLEAMLARASGEPFKAAVQRSLALAREADAVELAREANVLGYHAALLEGDGPLARAHLQEALRIRGRLAATLPDELRQRFLARRELAELAQIERAASEEAVDPKARACDRCGHAACLGACFRRSSRADASSSEPAPALKRMVGRDPAMLSLVSAVQKVGQSDATVLVQGESGTGKELVAEAIHEASPRRSGPLVKVNCAALVETLLLSELFGHEKGSFTGAAARRRGRFELAEGGTLFLDEIGDISPRTQVALLRILQDKTYERVGGVTPLRANVRIVCATHRDLRAMVARGEFREDLYYRLRGFVLEVPALRQRMGDLLLIVSALLERIAAERGTPAKRLSSEALEALSGYGWPGNIRELENALRAAALFAEGDMIEVEDFTNNVDGLRSIAMAAESAPSTSSTSSTSSMPSTPPPSAYDLDFGTLNASDVPTDVPDVQTDASAEEQPSRNERSADQTPTDVAYAHVRAGTSLSELKRTIERDCIARALAESRGNITRAALLLGMKRPRLSQLVKQYGFGGVSED